MFSNAVPAPAPKVSLANIFSFGALGVPIYGVLVIFGVYLPRHYVSLMTTPTAGVGAAVGFIVVSAAITIVRIIDVFFDPLVALLMDRTKTPIGRYRPWLILGSPFLLLGLYRVLAPTLPVSPGYRVFWRALAFLLPHSIRDAPSGAMAGYLIAWLVVSYIGLSMMTLGIAAWGAVLAKNYDDRARVYGWTQAMGVVGSVAILCMPLFTHGKIAPGLKASMPILGTIFIIAIPIALLITVVFTPERIMPIPQRPKFQLSDYWRALEHPAMLRLVLADLALTLGPGTTAPLYVYYFHDAKGFTVPSVSLLLISYIGSGILGAPFWGKMAQRFGKHRTVQIACVFYSITQAILMALPRVWPHYSFAQALPTVLGMFAVGFCASAFLLLVRAMVADVADEVRLEQRQDLTGLLFSMVTTTTKIGASITVLIVYPILALVHYNGAEGAVNTPHAIFGLEMCYLFAPIILVWFGGAMFFGYKLDAKRHEQIRAALESHDEAAALESLAGPTAMSEAAPAE